MPICARCGRNIPDDAILCPYCGERVSVVKAEMQPLTMAALSKMNELKNPSFAAVLGGFFGIFGIWGIGHFYVGKITNAVLWLIAGLVAYGVTMLTLFYTVFGYFRSSFPGIVFPYTVPYTWVILPILIVLDILGLYWQTYDAYEDAKHFNDYYTKENKAPW